MFYYQKVDAAREGKRELYMRDRERKKIEGKQSEILLLKVLKALLPDLLLPHGSCG